MNYSRILNAYITNVKNPVYSIKVELPSTEETIEDALQKLGIRKPDDVRIEKIETNIYALENIPGYYEFFGMVGIDAVKTINNINYLSVMLDGLDDWELDTLEAAQEYEGNCSIENLIDMSSNIDSYYLYPDITDYRDLGEYYVHEVEAFDIDQLGTLGNYIDYASYGRDLEYGGVGTFVSGGWLEVGGYIRQAFSGEDEDNPYVILNAEYFDQFDGEKEDDAPVFAGYNIENLW